MQPDQDQQPSADDNYQPRIDETRQLQTTPQSAQAQPAQPQHEQAIRYDPVRQAPQYAPATLEQPAGPQHPTEDPGRVFSILGLIGAFIFMQLPGLILSIIGYRKSKKASFKTTLAMIGIWLNALGILLIMGVLTLITWAAYQGVQARAIDTARSDTAMSIMKKAQVYAMQNTYTYPTIDELRSTTSETTLTTEESAKLKDTTKPSGDDVGYTTCKDSDGTITGINIYLYSETQQLATAYASSGACKSSE